MSRAYRPGWRCRPVVSSRVLAGAVSSFTLWVHGFELAENQCSVVKSFVVSWAIKVGAKACKLGFLPRKRCRNASRDSSFVEQSFVLETRTYSAFSRPNSVSNAVFAFVLSNNLIFFATRPKAGHLGSNHPSPSGPGFPECIVGPVSAVVRWINMTSRTWFWPDRSRIGVGANARCPPALEHTGVAGSSTAYGPVV